MFNSSFLRKLVLCTLFLTYNVFADNQKQRGMSLEQQVSQVELMEPSPLISRTTFINRSKLKRVQLSPDGLKLVYQVIEGNEDRKLVSVWHYDITNKVSEKLFTQKHLTWLKWSFDSRYLIFRSANSIAVSDLNHRKPPKIIETLNASKHEEWLGLVPNDPHAIMVRKRNEIDDEYVVKKIRFSGDSTEIYSTKERFDDFGLDADGKPSYLIINNLAPRNKGEKYVYAINKNKLNKIWQCEWDDPCNILQYQPQERRLLLQSNVNNNFTHLVEIEKDGKQTVIHQDPRLYGDLEFVSGSIENRNFYPIIATYYGDNSKSYAIDSRFEQHTKFLASHFPKQSLSIDIPSAISRAEQLQRGQWLISPKSNSATNEHYLYQLSNQSLTKILVKQQALANKNNSLINQQQVSPRIAINYPARDGFIIPAYLTLPKGKVANEAPLIVFPHGGPWSNDSSGFDMMAQFLANRGAIVLQPNFRASTGLGKAHQYGTKNDFGLGTTHFDIIDGVDFLLKNGIGHPDKLAIAGHSFGGFSALTALSFEPNKFKVAFAGAPPSHIGRSAKYYYRFQKKRFGEVNRYYMKHLVVDWDDKDAYNAAYQNSPEAHISNLKTPLTIWAGKNDGRVFIVDVKNYASKALSLNKPVNLFVDPQAKHSPNSKNALTSYLFLMEATMGRYLPTLVEKINKSDKQLFRFLNKHMTIKTEDLISPNVH